MNGVEAASPRHDGPQTAGSRLHWRAVVGAALVTAAAAGVVFAHRAAQQPPSQRWVVSVAEVAAGTTLRSEDLGTAAIDLPEGIDAVPAERASELVGRVAGNDLAEGGLLRRGDLMDEGRYADPDEVEVAVSLDPARVPLGAFGPGDLVTLLRTTADGETAEVAPRARVNQVGDDASSGSGIGAGTSVRVRLTVDDMALAAATVSAAVADELTVVLPAPGPEAAP